MLEDLDFEDIQAEIAQDEIDERTPERPDPEKVAKELQRVRDFIQRAETLPRDSKTEKLLEVTRIIAERPPERRRVVIFTESLVTQDYLRQMLVSESVDTLPSR